MKHIRVLLPIIVVGMLLIQFAGFSLYAIRQRAFIAHNYLHPKQVVNRILGIGIRGGRWFTRLDGEISLITSGKVRSKQVLSGLNGWLFYQSKTDGDPIGDYQGEIRYSKEEMATARNELIRLNNYLTSQGVDFAFLVAPNKEVMYAEYMPHKIARSSEITRTDVMMNYIAQNSCIKLAYVKEQLLQNKNIQDLYYPLDTHWNFLGGYVGSQCVLSLLGRNRKELRQCEIVQDVAPFRYDLPKIALAERVYRSNEKMWRVKGLEKPIGEDFSIEKNKGIKYISNNENASGVLVIIGDSFRMAMLPLLVDEFNEVYCVHRGDCKDLKKLLSETNPEAVILEVVERYSGSIGGFIEQSLRPN